MPGRLRAGPARAASREGGTAGDAPAGGPGTAGAPPGAPGPAERAGPTVGASPGTAHAGSGEPEFTELSARRLGPVRRYFLRHPVVMDVVVAVCFVLPAVLTAVFDPTSPRSTGLLVVMAALGGAALMWRRRRPLLTAPAVGVLAVTTVGTTGTLNGYDLAIAFVVYAVAASRPPRTAWLTLLGLGLPAIAAVLLWEQPVDLSGSPFPVDAEGLPEGGADTRVPSVTSLALLSLVAMAIGTGVRNRRLHVAALVDRANALAVEHEQGAMLAAAAERARIAREMHDVVAHSLSVMIALADGAGAAMERSPERAREALDELSGTGRAALADMRRVLGALRDPGAPLDPQPGSVDLEHLVEGFRTAGVPVRWTRTGPPLPADAGLQLAVFRIVQEALTNVLRHAPGTARVDVVLACTGRSVEITVTDSGGAMGTARAPEAGGAGRGLIGMRERATVYGGRVQAGRHDGGWRVHAVLSTGEEDR